jgi:hypothetical protein
MADMRARSPVAHTAASRAYSAIRAGGCAALLVLVLDFARVEHYRAPAAPVLFNAVAGSWSWAREAAAVGLIAACLAAVLIVPARRPRAHPVLVAWCAAAAALVLFFTVTPVQVLIAVYAAGILAVTSHRSPVTPATLAISAGAGVGGGLLVVALWNPSRSAPVPGVHPQTGVQLLFVVLVVVAAAATAAVAIVAARRASGTNGPLALKARAWQYLAAGPLTAATAALMLPLLRASHAVHIEARCPATHFGHCTAAPAVWMFFLVAGPVLGLVFGSYACAVTADQPPGPPPRRPPPEPPEPPGEPRPDGSRAGGLLVKI